VGRGLKKLKLRSIFFWLHLSIGSLAGLVILVMCVSGILLAFERQVIAWDASRYRVAPSKDLPRVPVDLLLASPRQPSNITIHSDRRAPLEFGYGRERTVFINPYSGEVLGQGSKPIRRFFATVEMWHRSLGGELRTGFGRKITGAANLLFVFLISSGPYLWWPRKRTWQHFKAVLLFRRGLPARQRDWNWHHAAGIWCALPLFFISVSGVVMSYGTAPRQAAATQAPSAHPRTLESLLAKAETQFPGWRSISFRVPPPYAGFILLNMDRGNGGQPGKRAQLTLDRSTGTVLSQEASRPRTWNRFIHTGEAGGLAGQVVAAVASLGGTLLVWTGLSLALRRLFKFTGRFRLERPQLTSADPMIK
jgi:uncharacterized iron-regulated membrane protein